MRPNWFMQNFTSGVMFEDIIKTGALHLPAADATISFIDVADIASAAFATLSQSNHFGNSYTLTGAESLSHFDVAGITSRASGKTIRYIPLSEEDAIAGLTKNNVPEGLVTRWTDFYRKIRSGFCSPVTNDIELLTGHRPVLFEDFAKENAAVWG